MTTKSEDDPDSKPCWIDSIDPAEASPELSAMYTQVGAVHNKIHNLYRAFSLQPAPLRTCQPWRQLQGAAGR